MIFFSLTADAFTSKLNCANLLNQSAAYIFIAMGLVFVLLLGEIDLSAGYTAGTSAAIMGVVMTQKGYAWPVAVLALPRAPAPSSVCRSACSSPGSGSRRSS